MTNDLKKLEEKAEIKAFGHIPCSLQDAEDFAKRIANSDFCPSECKGKPDNILVRLQLGAEVGLKPMQSIQNIAVINGRPTLWGDAALAVVKAHPDFEDIKEYFSEDENTAICEIRRTRESICKRTFSIDDAKNAGLWAKEYTKADGRKISSVWKSYPKRMLQMRARGFAIRDSFPDALKGINIREEVEDYKPIQKEKNMGAIDFETVASQPIKQEQEEPKQLEEQQHAVTTPAQPDEKLNTTTDEDVTILAAKINQAYKDQKISALQVSEWLKKADCRTLEEMKIETLRAICEKFCG